MAYYGLSNPTIAKLDTATNKYTGGFRCGEAVSTSVTPNFNSASLFGDNHETENVNTFKNADVALGVTRMPIAAKNVLFGHTVEDETQEETSNVKDVGNYVGYGFMVNELVNGVNSYVACVLTKVKFSEGEESYETQGDSIVFKTPTLSGKAIGDSTGVWRKKKTFADEESAQAWIDTELEITSEGA